MKILFLTRRFWPDVGGVEKHVYEVSKRLAKLGHKVTVITQSQGEKIGIDGIKIVRIGIFPKNSSEKFQVWNWFWKNRKLIKDANIVHAHDVYFWYWPLKLLFLSKKSFVTFHGYESYPIKKKAIISRKLSEFLTDGNIIVGEFIKKWYGTTSDCVTYGGVEMSNLSAGEADIKNQKLKRPKKDSAVFIGRLDDQTGILEYAKAVDIIRERYPNFMFEIVGDGKLARHLKKYRPLGFNTNPNYYLRKYNFAFVSRYLSILEALANKRLVFALYDNSIKEDYLKMSPFAKFIIITNSPQKLSDKVMYFLNNPKEISKFTDPGFKWVKKQGWEEVVRLYLEIWKK